MAEYIIQKAVAPDKVVKANRRSLAHYSANYTAEAKYDGCCGVITLPTTGGGFAQSRTGEPCMALDKRVHHNAEALSGAVQEHGGLVIIGEAWWPGRDQFSEISGTFRRHAVSEKLWFPINECLTLEEFTQGYSDVPQWQRRQRLGGIQTKSQLWPAGEYGGAQAKCDELADLGGYDGLILRDPKGGWRRGNGTTGEIIKIKRVLSFDLVVTGIKEGVGKFENMLGAMSVDFNGKTLWVNGGTVAQRVGWFHDPAKSLIGQIVEVEAMDYSSEGLLREPRFKGIRFDKLAPDETSVI